MRFGSLETFGVSLMEGPGAAFLAFFSRNFNKLSNQPCSRAGFLIISWHLGGRESKARLIHDAVLLYFLSDASQSS